MTRSPTFIVAVLFLLATAGPAQAQFGGPPGGAGKASVELAWRQTPAAGETAMLGLVLEIEPRWHVQAGEGSGDEQPPYLATTVSVEAPAGWNVGETRWPAAHTFELGVGKYAERLAGYEGRVLLAVPIDIPADAAAGPHAISVRLGYQACDDSVCIMPTETRTRGTVTLGTTAAAGPDIANLFAATLDRSGDDPAHGAAPASSAGFGAGRVKAEIAWYEDRLEPGATAHLGVIIDIEPAWHIQAGAGVPDDLIATTVDLTLPDGWSVAGPIVWPEGEAFTISEGEYTIRGIGYEGRVLVVVPVTIDANGAPGDYTVSAKVGYQACDAGVCERPTDIVARGDATVVAAGSPVVPRPRDQAVLRLFQATLGATAAGGAAAGDAAMAIEGGLLAALLLALVGGFLLNLTPCVLPVIPLKIMSLAHTAGNRRRTLMLGIVMSLGIVAFWMGMGVAIISITEFTSVNQLFQYPLFSIGVGVVIGILAFGMCGLFSVQLPQFVYRISPSQESATGSFGFGIMTAVLSTPCTAPFMGFAAAAAAAVGHPTIVLTVFGAIGAGMALPYLVLAAFPQLVNDMPRTGPASELIKQVMGLLMLAAAGYFVGVGISGWLAEAPAPPSRLYWWPVFALVATAFGWMAWRTVQITAVRGKRLVFGGIGVLGVLASAYGAVRLSGEDKTIAWVYYTPAAFDAALADGDAVVLEFTAEWCLNCKFLERSVLNSRNVARRLAEDDVVPMKVDLTGNNRAGAAKLEESGSLTIPWIVVYRPSGERVFAQNWYSPEMLLDGIDEALGTTVAKK